MWASTHASAPAPVGAGRGRGTRERDPRCGSQATCARRRPGRPFGASTERRHALEKYRTEILEVRTKLGDRPPAPHTKWPGGARTPPGWFAFQLIPPLS